MLSSKLIKEYNSAVWHFNPTNGAGFRPLREAVEKIVKNAREDDVKEQEAKTQALGIITEIRKLSDVCAAEGADGKAYKSAIKLLKSNKTSYKIQEQ